MTLTGIHLLLTYKCDSECEHCFLWCSPGSEGTMTVRQIERILRQAKQLPSVDTVYFEGGEPFLFYPVLQKGVQMARKMGFAVGIVSNAYWATDVEDAAEWLRPFARYGISDLSLSSDEHHGEDESRTRSDKALRAARRLGMPASVIRVRGIRFYSCASPGKTEGGEIYFRGRAAVNLAPKAVGRPWRSLDSCPEEPPNISRVHVDAFGNVQFCQGITIGNLWRRPLKDIFRRFDPGLHPIVGPLAREGPVAMARELGMRPKRAYADPCHMCYDIRCRLRKRNRYPDILRPDQAYGGSRRT